MIYIWLNLGPILVATVIGLLIASVFYRSTPRAFSPATITTAALGLFWLSSILAGALILAPPKAAPWIMAVGSAVVIWAGFVAPVVAVTGRFRGLTGATIIRDALYWLLTMVAQAVAMKLIGLVPPPA